MNDRKYSSSINNSYFETLMPVKNQVKNHFTIFNIQNYPQKNEEIFYLSCWNFYFTVDNPIFLACEQSKHSVFQKFYYFFHKIFQITRTFPFLRCYCCWHLKFIVRQCTKTFEKYFFLWVIGKFYDDQLLPQEKH